MTTCGPMAAASASHGTEATARASPVARRICPGVTRPAAVTRRGPMRWTVSTPLTASK